MDDMKENMFNFEKYQIPNYVESEPNRQKKEEENLKNLNDMLQQKQNESHCDYIGDIDQAQSNNKSEIQKSLFHDVREQTVQQQNPDKEIQSNTVSNIRGQVWEDKQKEIKEKSPFRNFKSYQLRPFIVQSTFFFRDIKSELLTVSLIQKFQEIFKNNDIPIFLRPYEVIVVTERSGLKEMLPQFLSIDELKKQNPQSKNLDDIYQRIFIGQFKEAQKNFIESLAGYSLICYLLEIRHRANNDILIDNQGHIIHINIQHIFEKPEYFYFFGAAHFKLTKVFKIEYFCKKLQSFQQKEYVNLMGGRDSSQFDYFKSLLFRGFKEIKKHVSAICNLVQIMVDESFLTQNDMIQFRGRFKETYTDKELTDYVDNLIKESYDATSTNHFDSICFRTFGIMK